MLLLPVYVKPNITEATSKAASPSSLTYTSNRSTATVNLDSISAVSGSFATSTSEQTASFSISTNNATGYTLTLKTTGNDTALTDDTNSNTSTNHLNTISSSTTADDFTVNTWGLVPNKYRSNNTTVTNDTSNPTYFPASSTGFTIDETTAANTTANNYTVGIGIKVNYDTRSATYANDTLVAEYVANPVTYSISYYSNTSDTVDDMPLTNPQTGTISDPTTSTGDIITTLASAPTRDGYTFLGWCAGNSAGTADTTNNTSITNITTTDDVDSCSSTVYDADQSFGINATGSSPDAYYLYAMWAPEAPDLPCEAGYICYRGNGATAGTMPDQEVTTSTVMLTSSNFSRPGYGFAGWNTSSDGTGTSYGPAETINPGNLSTEGLKLYAKWLAPSGVLQTWAGANNMNAGDVIALRDNRDNEVYTVAKLADNNVWITENLRLVPNTANITAKNTHNPTDTFLSALSSSSSSTTQCSADTAACNDHVYFYTGNMDRTKTQQPTGNDSAYAWYSYGTMYNWYTATAGNGTNSKNSGSVSGDICPSGWHLPTGGSSGEYAALSSALGGNSSTGATNIRKYPNNFIWSGDYNPSTQIPDGRGTQARIWSSTANSAAKSYRMGFNSSSITPAGTWNKWDNFAVRCIYQGGNLPYSAVTVDFEGTGINSLTFTSQGYDTETATPASPTVNIVEGAGYTVTANLTTGYEVSSWSTTTNGTLGNTTTTNPAANPNTYTITGDATLTITGQITPTYDVTVTLGEHVTGISFSHPTYGTINITPQNSTDNGDGTYTNTATLYRGVEYTLSSSFEDGYTLHEWTIGSNSTIGSTTSAATTYSITGNTTLGITAEETDELTYTLVYSAGQGTDAPDSETETVYTNTHDFTITNSAPIYYGYTFTGWSETADANNNGTTVDYTSGDTITLASTSATTTKTLYPVYQAVTSCPSGYICYYENGADVINGGRGTMTNQSATSNSTANLIPTNYSKNGYGFAGWTTSENATPYGPNATITTPDLSSTGLALYAKWVKSTGTLQSWSGCNALAQNSVIALTDTRDNETYAVAKLADDNCWIVENLRLDPSTANITNQNTHNPASGFTTAAASSSSVNTMCNTDGDTSCNDQIQYNTNSLNRSLTQTYNGNNSSSAWYSYGVYYNWHTATAGNGTISTEANANVAGDICPTSWHLPTSTASGEYAALNTAANSGSTSSDAGLRAYPANFLWSGDYKNTQRNSSYSNGRYWTATGYDSANGYRFGFQSTSVTPSGNYRKWDGFAVRCIYDGEAPVYSTVTVTIPEHATSVTFTNSKYGTRTATTNSNTISIVQGATYTITANFDISYELSSWSNGQNSTIGSTTANPTTFSIANDTTLSFTSQNIPTYTVTVNLDDNTTNVVFANADYPTQSISTTGNTVTLRRGIPYTITASFASGYQLNSWSTSANGTLGPTMTNPTTYTVANTTALFVTSKEIVPAECASSPTLSTIAQGVVYMQDINSYNYASILSNMSTSISYKIKDSRDNKNYCVGKLADNKIWMATNLDIAGGTGISANDTDVDINYINSFTTSNNLTKDNNNNTIVLPASSPYGFNTDNYSYVYNSNNITCGKGDPCYSYYSWDTATLGSGRGISTSNINAPYSICPKGWHLPITSEDFVPLISLLGSYGGRDNDSATSAALRGSPSYFQFSGYVNNGEYEPGYPSAYYWSATTNWSDDAKRLYFSMDYVHPSAGNDNRNGFAVRCVANPTSAVTINMDANITSVTFTDEANNTVTATPSSNVVSLKHGVTYNISATYNSGYELDTWSTTTGGVLGETILDPTTYTITNVTTLSATSRQSLGPPPLSTCYNRISGINYMQELNDSNTATIMNAMAEGTQYHLRDRRDGTPYCVAKIAGAIWMTQNLRITGTISALDSNFTGSSINVSQYDLRTNGQNECTSDNGYINICSHVADSTDLNNINSNNITYTVEQIGAWYNFAAASAGTVTGKDYAANANQDICPAGWKMPNRDTSSPAGSIDSIANSTYVSSFMPVTGGSYQGGTIRYLNYAYWWSSSVYSTTGGFGYFLSSSGAQTLSIGGYGQSRVTGLFIRCVRR